MRILCLSVILAACFPQFGRAEYGPLLARIDPAIAARACAEANFREGKAINHGLKSGKPAEIENVLQTALIELRATDRTSTNYPARAFCIHELVPSGLSPGKGPIAVHGKGPTDDVRRFLALGIVYKYYDPDDSWKLRVGPVDLTDLAENHLDSPWGRQAFLMMTWMGWSQGACQEGPDQFREVIRHGEEFLNKLPNSEISADVRLEVAKAYTTWWDLSRSRPDQSIDPRKYEPGAEQARKKAILLYLFYLAGQKQDSPKIQETVKALEGKGDQQPSYDYFCEDYED